MRRFPRPGAVIRLLSVLSAWACLGCTAHQGGYVFSKLEGRKVGKMAYTPPEVLLEDLRKSGKDDLDIAIDSKMIPHGGILKVKDNVYYSTNPIVRLSIEDGTGPMECDEAEVKDASVPMSAGSNGFMPSPTYILPKTNTVIECQVKRKMRYPARISFIGVKGDTVARYEIRPAATMK
jgi:hypothetical protein